MTKKELLTAYRAAVIELDELENQLTRVGTDGRPSDCRSFCLDRDMRGTNEPAAAASQLADGLESIARRKREELARMADPVYALLSSISDGRTFMVVQRYYMMADTDEHISSIMNISRSRVNQLRRDFLRSA
ncbi:MAG: hypothetical protein IJZ74_10750 [Clostridia bacterium]|nr:hypothetical protein [Clostridia bacterium]